MYTLGDLVQAYTSGHIYAREILDHDGYVICHVIESSRCPEDNTPALALLSHLNRGQSPLTWSN